jgi:sRNA-binding carbon storage regulator CsrA
VTVVKRGHGQVRLGIEAPPEMAAFREEISPRLHAPLLVQPIV